MSKHNLIEITKNKVGTGILVEKDGYISMSEGENKALFEEARRINESSESDGFYCPYPFVVSAVFQKFGIENANGRIYPEGVLKKQVEKYQQNINEKRAYGEQNHPSDTTIDLGRIAMNILELHWVDRTLVGKLEVITTPGFRKYGIVSTPGDSTANLLLQGLKVGVSSRGLGSVENKMGKYIVGDDYELVCWDFVSDPSTPNAWVDRDEEKLRPYIESTEKKGTIISENNTKLEKFSKFDSWLSLND
jgi:hypothetical protein